MKKLLLIASLLSVSGVLAYANQGQAQYNLKEDRIDLLKGTSIEERSARTCAIAGAIIGAVTFGGPYISKGALVRTIFMGGVGACVGWWSGAIVGLGSLKFMKFFKKFPAEAVIGSSAAGVILYCLKK